MADRKNKLGLSVAIQLNHDIPLRAMIIREICSQPVGQGRCEQLFTLLRRSSSRLRRIPLWNRATATEVSLRFCLGISEDRFCKALRVPEKRADQC